MRVSKFSIKTENQSVDASLETFTATLEDSENLKTDQTFQSAISTSIVGYENFNVFQSSLVKENGFLQGVFSKSSNFPEGSPGSPDSVDTILISAR